MSVTEFCIWEGGWLRRPALSPILDRDCSSEPSIAWHTDNVASEVEEDTADDLL
jgi:hypothetical protein